MTIPSKNAASETPRSDHYRTLFNQRKEMTDLIDWLLNEFAQEERRLRDAEYSRRYSEEGAQHDRDALTIATRARIDAEDRAEAAERASRSEREGVVSAGWRYRDKATGIVTLTEQPPDRVLMVHQYEVTELFARDPLSAAPEQKEGK